MSSVNFSSAELADMLKYYQAQYTEAMAKVTHIQSMIKKLGGAVSEMPESEASESVTVVAEPAVRVRKNAAAPRVKRKRGRQPIWSEMILKALKKFDRPLTYKDLMREAKIQGGIVGNDKDATIKAAVNQSVNRLKNFNKKIQSVKVEGKTGKYLVLNKWIDESGNLIEEYGRRVL